MPGSDVKGKKMGGWRMKNRGEDSSGPQWWERAQERNAPRAWSRTPPSLVPSHLLPPLPGPVRWEGNRNILEVSEGTEHLPKDLADSRLRDG